LTHSPGYCETEKAKRGKFKGESKLLKKKEKKKTKKEKKKEN